MNDNGNDNGINNISEDSFTEVKENLTGSGRHIRVQGKLNNRVPNRTEKVATAVIGLLAGVGVYTVIDWIVKGAEFIVKLIG